MTRKEAFAFFALTSILLFFLFFTIYTITYNRRIKISLREEIISQAFIIRDNLLIAEAKNPREDLLDLVAQLANDDLKITLKPQPLSKNTFAIKNFPPDERKWFVITIPLNLRNFSGQLEVARPFVFKSPPYISYLLLFLLISIISAFLFFSLSGKPAKEFIFSFRGEREAWQKFIGTPEEIGEIARIAWEKEGKKDEIIERLKDKEQNLQILVSLIKDPSFILDENRRFLFANSRFLQLCRVDESSLLSRASLSLFIKDVRVEKFIDAVMQKGEIEGFEIELNGDFYSATGKVFPLEKKGIRVACVLRNITERKKWERMKQEFGAAVAYEIKTPLTAIKGLVETLRAKMRGKNRQSLSLIDMHTERLANIAEDLISLSHLEKTFPVLNLADINLKKVLKEVMSLFSHSLKRKRLQARLSLPKGDIFIKGDPYLLRQAFHSLLDNAIRYTAFAERRPAERGKIEIKLTESLSYVEVSFSDTGVGIPKEELEKIFEQSYVIDKKTGGIGLGLSIVKRIIDLHQGKIEVKSEVGKGSTFTLFLPKRIG